MILDHETLVWIAFVLSAFASGSIPFGLIIARARGMNIREHGSGNIGATNVWRVLGKSAGVRCLILDVGKGLVPTAVAGLTHGLMAEGAITSAQAAWWLGVGSAAVLGHMFTPWARFKGGKGVATGLGSLLGIYPYLTIPTLACVVVWAVMVKGTRRVGVSSCVAAVSLPLWVWLWSLTRDHNGGLTSFLVGTGLLAAMVVIRHRGNLARTLAGTEPRIGDPVTPEESAATKGSSKTSLSESPAHDAKQNEP
jgi:acyl phosphate:glycerol-3-phosphate acyltransferase